MQYTRYPPSPELTKIAEARSPQLKNHIAVVYDPECKHDYEIHKRPSELKILMILREYTDVKLWRNAITSAIRIRSGVGLAEAIHGKRRD
jgi:hypothetical protein